MLSFLISVMLIMRLIHTKVLPTWMLNHLTVRPIIRLIGSVGNQTGKSLSIIGRS